MPAPHITKVGDACTVRFPKAGAYPFFCQVHYAQGMKGVITVGSGGGSGADHHRRQWGRQQRCPGHHAEGGGAPSAGKPAIYWASWGLLAVGALLALVLIALYVRFTPGFDRQKRLEEEGGSPLITSRGRRFELDDNRTSLGLLKIIAGGRCARLAHRPTIATPSRAWPRRGPPVTRR
jgi:hypothetical protein